MKFLRKMFFVIFAIIVVVGIAVGIVVNLPAVGKNPSGERQARIEKSPNYRNGEFQNYDAPTDEISLKGLVVNLYKNFFVEHKDKVPTQKLPVVKTNLKDLENNSLVWLGHSSYFLKIGDKNILIDPVFNSASPFSFMVKPFDMEYHYTALDLPEKIDLLIISHDHYDHLDYELMKEIRPRIQNVLVPLGVGAHFEYWDFDEKIITELDWYQEATIGEMKLTCLPARHYSGRGLSKAKMLWGAYMLESADKSIYIGGDSGYGSQIAEIAEKFPNIDFAILENGQYNEAWSDIHFLPEDLIKVIKTLNPKRLFTGHNSKFALARHPWYEPLDNVLEASKKEKFNLATPKIGEVINLEEEHQTFEAWWKNVK